MCVRSTWERRIRPRVGSRDGEGGRRAAAEPRRRSGARRIEQAHVQIPNAAGGWILSGAASGRVSFHPSPSPAFFLFSLNNWFGLICFPVITIFYFISGLFHFC